MAVSGERRQAVDELGGAFLCVWSSHERGRPPEHREAVNTIDLLGKHDRAVPVRYLKGRLSVN